MPETFQMLMRKHKNFQMPKFVVSLEGSKLDPVKYPILDINVRTSVANDMSTCDFTIAAYYDLGKKALEPDIYTEFKPGKVIDVKIGYEDDIVGVFRGYINSISFNFNESGPTVTVSCLDIRGTLVNSYEWVKHPNENVKDVIWKVLDKRCGRMGRVGKIEFLFDAAVKENLFGKELDDFRFISCLAADTFHTFYTKYNKVIFCDNKMKSAKKKVELNWGESLIDFWTEIDLSKQFGSVKVYSTSPKDQKQISSNYGDAQGDGESGKDLSGMVRTKQKIVYTTLAIDDHQAELLAKRTMEDAASRLVHCKGTTIGLPEIRSGDKVIVGGMGKGIDGEYYMTHVTHRINASGYITSFEGVSSHVTIGMHRLNRLESAG